MPYPHKKKAAYYSSRPRRPIDKQIITSAAALTNSTTYQTLLTVTVPSTIVGVRWDYQVHAATGTAPKYAWAIVVVREGSSNGTVALGGGSPLYQPEQNVITWGCGASCYTVGSVAWLPHDQGSTKTMRKLQGGDKVVLAMNTNTAVAGELIGAVQFFLKS